MSWQIEIDRDATFHFYGRTLQHVRLVSPGPDRVDSCIAQNWVPANNLQLLDSSFFVDDGRKLNSSGDTRPPCLQRVNRVCTLDSLSHTCFTDLYLYGLGCILGKGNQVNCDSQNSWKCDS